MRQLKEMAFGDAEVGATLCARHKTAFHTVMCLVCFVQWCFVAKYLLCSVECSVDAGLVEVAELLGQPLANHICIARAFHFLIGSEDFNISFNLCLLAGGKGCSLAPFLGVVCLCLCHNFVG